MKKQYIYFFIIILVLSIAIGEYIISNKTTEIGDSCTLSSYGCGDVVTNYICTDLNKQVFNLTNLPSYNKQIELGISCKEK